MGKENKLVRRQPSLRFFGFNKDIPLKTLDQIAEFRRGSFPQPYGLDKWYDDISGFPFVQVFDVDNNYKLKPDTKRKISAAARELSVFIPKGTIVLTIQGSIGRIAITQYDACCDRTLLIFQRFKVPLAEGFFVNALFLLFEIEKRSAPGGTIKTITKERLKSFQVALPPIEEQQQIADFLTAVDQRIQQLIQKKALLEDYKKGVMQQLFSQAIRFKDDDGDDFPDWEETKLGSITKWSSGGTPPKDNPDFWVGDIPWISAASMHERLYFDSPTMISTEGLLKGSRLAKKGTLLLLVRGSMLWNRIPVGITGRDVAFNQDVKSLEASKAVSVLFLLQWFIASENVLLHKVVGTGIGAGKLDTDEMKNLDMHLPHPDEQTKIANFLSTIDSKIEAVASQIIHTRTFKQGLLQQMFV